MPATSTERLSQPISGSIWYHFAVPSLDLVSECFARTRLSLPDPAQVLDLPLAGYLLAFVRNPKKTITIFQSRSHLTFLSYSWCSAFAASCCRPWALQCRLGFTISFTLIHDLNAGITLKLLRCFSLFFFSIYSLSIFILLSLSFAAHCWPFSRVQNFRPSRP